jgi:hypothetical protein
MTVDGDALSCRAVGSKPNAMSCERCRVRRKTDRIEVTLKRTFCFTGALRGVLPLLVAQQDQWIDQQRATRRNPCRGEPDDEHREHDTITIRGL